MRNTLLLVIAILACGGGVGLWFVLDRVGAAGASDLAPALPVRPADSSRAARAVRAPSAEERSVELAAPVVLGANDAVGEPPAAASSGRNSVEGTLLDRFGAPVRDRVWLLPEGRAHPPAGVDMGEFVTAVSDREGRFSLTIPSPGSWRLAVGAPGEPRVVPAPARELSTTVRCDVTVSGGAAVRVTFEEVPEAAEGLMLELVTLREPELGRGGRQGRRETDARALGRPDRGDRGASRGLREQGAGGGGASGPDGPQATDLGGRDGRGAMLAPPATAGPAILAAQRRAAPEQEGPGQDARDQDGGQRSRRGFRGPGDVGGQDRGEGGNQGERGGRRQGAEADPGQPAGPPPEVWRSERRLELTADELATGVVELVGLPVDRIARLDLRMGGRRFEGAARFVLKADALVEVHAFPLTSAEATSFHYRPVARPLASDVAPVGVRWGD